MTVERSKTFKLNDKELEIIYNSSKVLDDIVCNLTDDENLYIDGTYYDAQFVNEVYNFLCDLHGDNTLRVERG